MMNVPVDEQNMTGVPEVFRFRDPCGFMNGFCSDFDYFLPVDDPACDLPGLPLSPVQMVSQNIVDILIPGRKTSG